MTGVSVGSVDEGSADAPPVGTAIVRPMRHVRAVRERQAEQRAERTSAGESRAWRAWGWALGESAVAPVTDRVTDVPPSREEIEAEIAEADKRRMRGDRENRADGAANVLRWLIGADDRIPVRGQNRGELVGGSGDIVRSADQISRVLDEARQCRQAGLRAADYLDGVIATLEWVIGERSRAPISRHRAGPVIDRQLRQERLHAEDVVAQRGQAGILPANFGNGVRLSITWLLGEGTGQSI